MGAPSTSILLVRIPGKSLPSLPLCVNVPLTAIGAIDSDLCSCFTGVLLFAAFASVETARSCDVVCCRVVRDDALPRIRILDT